MTNSRVILVTGVSSGIGRATAERFAQQGCVVFGTVRNVQKAQAIPGVDLIEMDVRDETSVQRAIQSVVAKAKRIDVLVNNAGGTMLGSVEETSVVEAQALFDTNVFGALRTSQAVLPHMREQRSGRIINVSSVLGFLPAPYMGLYSASKHAIEGLSETLDHEVRNFGVRVVLVEPSYTKTNSTSQRRRPRLEFPPTTLIVTSCPVPSCAACKRLLGLTLSRPRSWTPRSADGRCVEHQGRGFAAEKAAPLHARRPRRRQPSKELRPGLIGTTPGSYGRRRFSLRPRRPP